MENEIKKLIEIYKARKRGNVSANLVVEDLESLLKFKQEHCCGNFIIEEVTHKRLELTAYNRGHHDGYMQAKNEGYK